MRSGREPAFSVGDPQMSVIYGQVSPKSIPSSASGSLAASQRRGRRELGLSALGAGCRVQGAGNHSPLSSACPSPASSNGKSVGSLTAALPPRNKPGDFSGSPEGAWPPAGAALPSTSPLPIPHLFPTTRHSACLTVTATTEPTAFPGLRGPRVCPVTASAPWQELLILYVRSVFPTSTKFELHKSVRTVTLYAKEPVFPNNPTVGTSP